MLGRMWRRRARGKERGRGIRRGIRRKSWIRLLEVSKRKFR